LDTSLFGFLLIAFAVIGVVAAAASYVGVGRVYRSLGRGGRYGIADLPPPATTLPPASTPDPIATEELRQMLQAKSDRRVDRGEEPLDVEAELAALLASTRDATPRDTPAPDHDPALRDEIRQLVIAANERRRRRGQPPLDVDAEVERRLRELGWGL